MREPGDTAAAFFWTGALAVDRYLSSCRHVELLRAVEVEFLAGDLSVEQFEREIEGYVALGLEPGSTPWSVDVGRVR